MPKFVGYLGNSFESGIGSVIAVSDGYYFRFEDKTGMDVVFVPEALVAGRSFSDVGGDYESGYLSEMRTTFGKIALLRGSRKGEVDLSYHKIEDAVFHTPEGGIAVRLTNNTGANTIKGTLVCACTAGDYAFKVCGADDPDAMGVVYESGIAAGQEAWVVTYGKADVLLQDTTASTRGYWARTSVTQAGRADITNAVPPGGGIVNHEIHFREIGHCIESKGSGTDVLARIMTHFN